MSKKSKVKSTNFIIETNCDCGGLMAYKIWLGVNGQRELRHATHGNINRDNVITPTLITPTLNTSTVTDSLCNSGALSSTGLPI